MRLLILISSLILGGCNLEACKNGVVYYSGPYALSPKFNPDGSLVLCGTSKTRVCVDEFDYSKDVPGVPQYDSKRCEGE